MKDADQKVVKPFGLLGPKYRVDYRGVLYLRLGWIPIIFMLVAYSLFWPTVSIRPYLYLGWVLSAAIVVMLVVATVKRGERLPL